MHPFRHKPVPETMSTSLDPYRPIRDYALIGDCHGAALVSRDGSIDWCCLGRFDAEPVFCRILDAGKGGYLQVRPADDARLSRQYLGATNILQTTFAAAEGKATVTDFLPVGRAPGAGVHDYVTLRAPFWLVRIIEGVEGRMRLSLGYRPTLDYARRPARLSVVPGRIDADGGPSLCTDLALEVDNDCAEAVVEVSAGQRHYLVLTPAPVQSAFVADRLPTLLNVTRAFWQEWAGYCRYEGPYRDAVLRSALALKLLIHAPTGAVVAAPTTSLPEEIGGERNWDYRYSWLRDATFTLYALAGLGYSGEARRFSQFLRHSCQATHPRLQIMYGIDGTDRLDEQILSHLDGYRSSRPVRIGNGAFDQRQLDVYGEVLDWAYLQQTLGARFDRPNRDFLKSLAHYVAEHWHEAGQGIWEMRGEPRHHVFGKIMCWVTLDRAIRMFGETPELQDARQAVLRSIREKGIAPEGNYLVQAYGLASPDAALLLVPMLGTPLSQETLAATIDMVQQTLGRGDYLLRYTGEDGLAGGEGAFLICSFWLVDALLVTGKIEQARELFERLLACANDVGLYAEEIDPETHQFLGNFPQAFTHLALIACATNFAILDEYGHEALQGTHADRARCGVEATSGWRALWAAFRRTGHVGRLRSSRDSSFPW